MKIALIIYFVLLLCLWIEVCLLHPEKFQNSNYGSNDRSDDDECLKNISTSWLKLIFRLFWTFVLGFLLLALIIALQTFVLLG